MFELLARWISRPIPCAVVIVKLSMAELMSLTSCVGDSRLAIPAVAALAVAVSPLVARQSGILNAPAEQRLRPAISAAAALAVIAPAPIIVATSDPKVNCRGVELAAKDASRVMV